jgi:histidinol-phosphatase (PHP family)
MERTCARAVELGLKSLPFTEHLDLTPWALHGSFVRRGARARVIDGALVAEPLDVGGHFESLERCRHKFPGLRILSGLELREPHWHAPACARVLARRDFELVLGFVHTLEDLEAPRAAGVTGPSRGTYVEAGAAYRQRAALDVVRAYLAEVVAMAQGDGPFAVLAHIDYPVRYWPAAAGPFDPGQVEEEYRKALETLAASGRALEVNTRVPLASKVVRWWYEAGGQAVTFGSDPHEPGRIASKLIETAAMVEAHGFRPGRTAHEMWGRAG